jgi:predicted RNase H-like HicB family nuclease
MPGMRRSKGKNEVVAASEARAENVGPYLRRPYARVVIPESDGTYRAEILEFPGCLAMGDTLGEALAALEEVAAEWLDAALKRNQEIPDPVEEAEFSGRLLLRMPKSLHKKAARLAEREGVSLNQFIVTGLAEHIGERKRLYNNWSFFLDSSNITVSAKVVTAPGEFPSSFVLSAARDVIPIRHIQQFS